MRKRREGERQEKGEKIGGKEEKERKRKKEKKKRVKIEGSDTPFPTSTRTGGRRGRV